MLDWLVVGGGPHGVHIALRLIEDAGVPRDAVRILDDEEELLARWRRTTGNTGMRYLRSPGVHHIDLASSSLQNFASRRGRRVAKPFTRPYARPALELFDLHCDDVIERNALEELHLRGRANRLELSGTRARVGYEDVAAGGRQRQLAARQVILALGAPHEPVWPEWAQEAIATAPEADARAAEGRIQHVFDPGFELVDDERDGVVAVVGAGISGAQVALRLAREGRRVILISRHALRVQQFDSDPGWQGPMNMSGYARIQDPNERRDRIREARHRGSMPPEVHAALRVAFADETIELVEEAEVASACIAEAGVALELNGETILADRVLLATGFPNVRPGGAWLDEAVEAHELPCADCGFPIVDRALRWHSRLFVTGPLAELEIGPVSRNLSGAKRASDRIVAAAHQLPMPSESRAGSDGEDAATKALEATPAATPPRRASSAERKRSRVA